MSYFPLMSANVSRAELVVCASHLAEDNGHEEEVEQQRLGQMAVVEGEEEHGEEDGHILVRRTAVGGAKQLQTRNCDHQGSDPAGRSEEHQ